MSETQGKILSRSYFWSCITLSEDCPFLSTSDPKLYYFGISLFFLYGAFMLMILVDLNFYWSLDKLQNQINFYINLVRKKVRRVQMDQRRLMSTQERTEKQLKRSEQCQRIVNHFRIALQRENSEQLSIMAKENTPRNATWSECHSIIDF